MTDRPKETVVSELVEKFGFKIMGSERLNQRYPAGLYAHQANAIEEARAGKNVCLSTSTASGKSLVFMTVAAHLIKANPSARALALYPARALIQDQLSKWQGLLTPLGLKRSYIDGGAPVKNRSSILANNQVILMTPDVAHAWLRGTLSAIHNPFGTGAIRGKMASAWCDSADFLLELRRQTTNL